ncbi:MAG: exosortase/archaeosortase family protein [Gemmataceae bacterium]
MNFLSGAPAASSPGVSPAAAEPRPGETCRAWITAGVIGTALLWSYWTTALAMVERWATEPQYSHGFLVPLFAAAVLWFRRAQWEKAHWAPELVGLPILVAGLAMHVIAGRIDFQPLDALSLLPTLAGAVLFVGGRQVFRWSWPALAFLVFMLPLPFAIESLMAQPLRRVATVCSTYLLQTLGYPALSEGNIIVIDQMQMGVAEACSGLGMLMTFFALATALVLVIEAPLVDRIILLLSAVPIAVIANVIRITVTGMAYYATGSDAVKNTMHDLAGWFMMPLALALFWAELWFLGRLLKPGTKTEARPLPFWSAAARKEAASLK